jgi:hypothetical protein
METKRKQFKKTEEAYERDMILLREFHQSWRNWTKDNRKGFFPIFNPEFQNRIRDVSGSAIKLYLFLGAHTDSQTGECMVSIKTIEKHLNASRRSVLSWFAELKRYGLIIRIQPGFKRMTHTFMVPYHPTFVQQSDGLRRLIADYSSEEEEEAEAAEIKE